MFIAISAGVGRSGTYIAIDNSLREIQEEKELNIFRWITEMRDNRPFMVQTEVSSLQSTILYPSFNSYLVLSGYFCVPVAFSSAKAVERAPPPSKRCQI